LKKILYTGARSGIAKKVIDKLLKNKNYYIYVSVHTESQLKSIKKIYKNFPNVECLKLDVTDDNDLKKIEHLDIDILVSNAATGICAPVSKIEIEKLKYNFNVNVFSNIKLVQIILNKMKKNNQGRIIMISSLAGILPVPYLGSYCATKASITKLTECLNLEFKLNKNNIKIILIEPGLYHTGFNQFMLSNYDIKNIFEDEIKIIEFENKIFNVLEHRNLESITNKIYKAIITNNPKFRYKSPLFEVIISKIYQLLQ